jgi:hypothetical protein
MSTTPTAAIETLMALPPLQIVVEKEARQVAYRLHHCSILFKKSDWGHSAIFEIATADFSVLLAPSASMLPLEVFDRKYRVEYPSREIWLSEVEACDGLNFYTDGSLLEGRAGFEVFPEELGLPLSFRLRFTPFWLVPTTV